MVVPRPTVSTVHSSAANDADGTGVHDADDRVGDPGDGARRRRPCPRGRRSRSRDCAAPRRRRRARPACSPATAAIALGWPATAPSAPAPRSTTATTQSSSAPRPCAHASTAVRRFGSRPRPRRPATAGAASWASTSSTERRRSASATATPSATSVTPLPRGPDTATTAPDGSSSRVGTRDAVQRRATLRRSRLAVPSSRRTPTNSAIWASAAIVASTPRSTRWSLPAGSSGSKTPRIDRPRACTAPTKP